MIQTWALHDIAIWAGNHGLLGTQAGLLTDPFLRTCCPCRFQFCHFGLISGYL